MIFEVSNKIRVGHPSDSFYKWAYENYVLDNPEYYKKQRMGLWTGRTPQELKLYEKIGNDIFMPYGVLHRIKEMWGEENPIYSRIQPLRSVQYRSNIKPYDYQERVVQEAIKGFHGVIVMPCGSGKTQTALEIVSRIGGRCLWLTHTQDLLNQSFERARSVFDIPYSTYGKITGGKVDIGTGMTFATVQTLSKLDLVQYKDAWDIVIVDECQHCVGSPTRVMQFYKVLSNVSAKYKFGLTATPYRSDGMEAAMFALLGDIVAQVDKSEVAHTTCPVKIEQWYTEYTPNMNVVLAGDGTLNYAALINDLTKNKERFEQVLQIIEARKNNGPMLVLGSRVEYVQKLSDSFSGKSLCLSGAGYSKAAKAERKSALKRLNDGEINCLFATYQLAKEGLDVPNLRTVVLATPEKDETTVTQSAGRVGRKADGKDYGTVIDIIDPFGMFLGWSKKRVKYYKKIDAEV